MNEMIESGTQDIGGVTEMIAVDEENRDLDSATDRLRRSLKTSKITCAILGVVIAVVFAARLLV